ncbi:DUF3726 domain-containing protein [Rhodobacteraceae bacterium KMM 6894]|nr:DUF3726 domain-containing protein [Rhodobacteraceae bacterium KMM 6894]
MSWSLNEIGSLTRKAARGAGFSWGMAEEAGRAARWLAGVGLPGPEALADLLEATDGMAHGMLCPSDPTTKDWRASGGMLCPIAAGTALCDMAGALAQARTLREVVQPLLLVPFVADAAGVSGRAQALTWPDAAFLFTKDLRGAIITTTPLARVVHLTQDAPTGLPPLACQLRYDLCPDVAARLTLLAERTYAPETDASRLGGAGAGLSDND